MPTRTLLLAFLFGAVGGAVGAWVLSAVGGDEPPLDVDPTLRAVRPLEAADRPEGERGPEGTGAGSPHPILLGSPAAGVSDDTWRAGLEERLQRIEATLAGLAQQVTALDEGGGDPDLEALSDKELKARASSLYAFRNYAGTLKAYEALLARDPGLDTKTKSEVLSAMAQCHRALGDPKRSDEIFQQVEALHGPGTAGAMTARYQRAWLRHAQDDLEGAREFMRQVARSDSSPRFWKLFSRANAADFSIRLGDTAHVRGELEDFKAALEGDDSQAGRRVRTYVDTLLQTLDG